MKKIILSLLFIAGFVFASDVTGSLYLTDHSADEQENWTVEMKMQEQDRKALEESNKQEMEARQKKELEEKREKCTPRKRECSKCERCFKTWYEWNGTTCEYKAIYKTSEAGDAYCF